ncbi:MAG: hypothetical protein AAGI38_15550, partial [Bacteroidota bacterium]
LSLVLFISISAPVEFSNSSVPASETIGPMEATGCCLTVRIDFILSLPGTVQISPNPVNVPGEVTLSVVDTVSVTRVKLITPTGATHHDETISDGETSFSMQNPSPGTHSMLIYTSVGEFTKQLHVN